MNNKQYNNVIEKTAKLSETDIKNAKAYKSGKNTVIEMTMKERFAAKYTGQRFSFGYPACPNLEDQEKLFRLLKPEDIGVRLTDGYMMEPEASVSAIVFAHPEARYFNVER